MNLLKYTICATLRIRLHEMRMLVVIFLILEDDHGFKITAPTEP